MAAPPTWSAVAPEKTLGCLVWVGNACPCTVDTRVTFSDKNVVEDSAASENADVVNDGGVVVVAVELEVVRDEVSAGVVVVVVVDEVNDEVSLETTTPVQNCCRPVNRRGQFSKVSALGDTMRPLCAGHSPARADAGSAA